MPIHDFHHAWIEEIKRALNRGILPPDLYALASIPTARVQPNARCSGKSPWESRLAAQLAGGYGPDVLTLEGPAQVTGDYADPSSGAGLALATAPPKVSFRARTADIYAAKANRIAVRHVSDHRVVAVIEIVSPGNKSTLPALRRFAEKAAELLRSGVHLMVIDLFPRDPRGIHEIIWNELDSAGFRLPDDRQLTLASYIGGAAQEAFVEPVAVGVALPDMPLFLTPGVYVQTPLEATYRSAWDAVPMIWRKTLEAAS